VLASLLPGIPMLHNGYEVVEHENVSVRSYSSINWKSTKNITTYIGKINTIRNAHPCFQSGRYIHVPTEQGITPHAQLFSFIRDSQTKKRDTCLVVVNMDFNNKADHVIVDLPTIEGYDFSKPYVLTDLLSNKRYKREGHFVTIVLEPGESHIFTISQRSSASSPAKR